MARGWHRHAPHRRLLLLHRRRWLLRMEAPYSRALREGTLVSPWAPPSERATFVPAVRGFAGCPAGSTITALLPVWRLMAIAIFFASPIMLLNLTAEMSGVSWREAVPF